jgi:hypothetical protein
MYRSLFPHIQLDYSEGFIHDVTDRVSGSFCCTIHVGLRMGRTLEPFGRSYCGDGPPLRGAVCALLDVLALERLVANLLAAVALHRSWSIFEGAGHTRLSSSVKEPVGQEPPCVRTFGQVNDH